MCLVKMAGNSVFVYAILVAAFQGSQSTRIRGGAGSGRHVQRSASPVRPQRLDSALGERDRAGADGLKCPAPNRGNRSSRIPPLHPHGPTRRHVRLLRRPVPRPCLVPGGPRQVQAVRRCRRARTGGRDGRAAGRNGAEIRASRSKAGRSSTVGRCTCRARATDAQARGRSCLGGAQ